MTFSDPELARVGLTEEGVKVYRFYFNEVDRARIDGETNGMAKLICDKRLRLLGAYISGPNAGELIHEYILAMREGIPITKISKMMHVYPTEAFALKRAADQYYKERLFTGLVPKIAGWLIRRGRRD